MSTPAKIVPGALAWRQANDPVERDRQMIGWAACRSKSEADPLGGFIYSSPLLVAEPHRKDADKLCGRFFTNPGWDGDEFDAPVDASAVFEQAGADPEVVQFINVLHGKESSGGPVAAFAYALSGISVLAVFGLMSLAVIIAKLAALALMLTLFAVMTLALFTRDGLERVFRFGKTYIGLSFFVFASSLVMAILALITKICMSIGGTLLSSNELLATMWAGLSPLLAVVILAGIFKKARIPSPFSLKGGLAWGAAAGGAGAAAVMGFDRIGDSMKRGASRLGHSVAGLPAIASRGGGGYRRGSNAGRVTHLPDGSRRCCRERWTADGGQSSPRHVQGRRPAWVGGSSGSTPARRVDGGRICHAYGRPHPEGGHRPQSRPGGGGQCRRPVREERGEAHSRRRPRALVERDGRRGPGSLREIGPAGGQVADRRRGCIRRPPARRSCHPAPTQGTTDRSRRGCDPARSVRPRGSRARRRGGSGSGRRSRWRRVCGQTSTSEPPGAADHRRPVSADGRVAIPPRGTSDRAKIIASLRGFQRHESRRS